MEMQNKIPEWEAQGNEPPAELKTSGFEAGYKPPAAYFNWFWHGVSACLKEIFEKLSGHATDENNPHNVTVEQLGLENVDNTADTEKYVKFAQEAAEARKVQNTMTVRLNGGRTEGSDQFTFDGSTDRTVNVTPAKIGAAEADLSNVDATVFKQLADTAGIVGGIPIVAAASDDGVTYTAEVADVTELTNGKIIVVVPTMTSTSTAPKLDVNNLGAKPIHLPLSTNTGILVQSEQAGYYVANRPVMLQFDSGYLPSGAWRVLGKQRPDANDIYGTIALENGGTGASSPELARQNLGAASKFYASAAIGTEWEGSGPYTQTVSVPGMLESDTPIIDFLPSVDMDAAEAETIAWSMMYRIDTAADSITVYASEPTTTAITIQILGVR